MPGLSKAAELRQKRANLVSRMREITDAPGGSEGAFTDEQRTELDRLHTEQERLLQDAERIERAEDAVADLAGSRGLIAGAQDTRDDVVAKEDRAAKFNAAFDSYLRHGLSGMKPEERSILQTRAAQSTAEDSLGGYIVPEGFYSSIVDAMLQFGGIRRSRATVVRTASGNPLPIPTVNDTSNKGRLLAENAAITNTGVTFGQVTLNAYTYSSDYVLVSRQLLQDSAFPLQPFIAKKLGERIGRITNEHFTTGDGAAKPKGISVGLTVGKTGATGQTTSVIYDDLVDLEHSVDADYRGNAQWMMADSSVKVMKKLKDGEGRPLWVPGIAVREPDSILGYGYVVNNDMAAMAASAVSIVFGDLSSYYVRDVQDIILLRLDERYADNLQVAFLAFSRHDGKLVDAGTHPIKSYVNSAS